MTGTNRPDGANPPADRRLLVVSYHFPPDPAIGGMRWAGVTRYLGRMGWHSWVVTAAPAGSEGRPEVTVAHCPPRTTLQDLYRRARAGRRRDRAAPDGTPATLPTPPTPASWLARLRTEASMLLSLPDGGRGWILTASRATRRLIAQARPAAIVSSGPPHSAHLAAWLATRGMALPWFVDLRDPWAGPHAEAWQAEPANHTVLGRWLPRRLERTVFRAATAVICNTQQLASALAGRYPTTAVEWIPNGADPETLPRVSGTPSPGLGLVHAGTVYGGRDPSPVLLALRDFLDRHPAARAATRFRIAGQIEGSYAGALQRQVADLDLAPWVETLGSLPRGEALSLVARSHLNVILAQKQEFQVPAKLYETVVIGTPAVVIASPASAAASEAKRLGAFVVAPDDTAGLVLVMEQAWRAPRPLAVADGASAASYAVIARRVDEMLARSLRAEP